MDYCILGIGNPGPEYTDTKHNVGWWVVEELARRHHVSLDRERLRCRYGRKNIAGRDVVLAEPLTFVNASGEAALRLALFFRLPPQRFIVTLDDLNLQPGQLRLRCSGSDGGHLGLRSVLQAFGTQEVPRLRVGIGAPQPGVSAVEWVLSPFSEEVLEVIRAAVQRAADCLEVALAEGLPQAMQRFND
jgi:PTH1 family peptidyl-tRNA hydrolase